MLEVARQLAARDEKLRRRVLFMAFTAEERGLIGFRTTHDLVREQPGRDAGFPAGSGTTRGVATLS